MDRHMRDALDDYITGHGGEDQFRDVDTETRCLSCGAPSDGDYWCADCYDAQHRDRCVECGELLAAEERIVCGACLRTHDEERAWEEMEA